MPRRRVYAPSSTGEAAEELGQHRTTPAGGGAYVRPYGFFAAMKQLSPAPVMLLGCLTVLTAIASSGGIRAADALEGKSERAATPDEVIAEVQAALERSYQQFLEIPRTFWDPNEAILVTPTFSPLTREDLIAHRYQGRWERLAAALRAPEYAGRRFIVRISAVGDRNRKVVWRRDFPVDAERLAADTRKLVPDNRTIRSVSDIDVSLEVRIPPAALPPGTYRAYMTFLTPDGAEHRFPGDSSFDDAVALVVRAAPFDIRRVLIPSQVADSPTMLTSVVAIANPGLRQFPLDTPEDCQARSVWSLQTYQGRIFVGYGDWVKNRGPIDLWSFAPEGTPNAPLATRNPGRHSFVAGDNPRLLFTHEYVVQDHSIDLFRACGDRLYVPGIDGMREKGPDGDLFANLYVREKGHWRKLSTIPQSLHTLDVMEQGRRLYVVVGNAGSNLMLSEDGGLSWTELTCAGKPVYADSLARFRDGILVYGGMDALYFCKEGRLGRHLVEVEPGQAFSHTHRRQAFLDGVVYTTHDGWGASKETRHPLFFLRDFNEGARIISQFQDSAVRDLFVNDRVLYVLTAAREGERFRGEIYASLDLRHWTRRARFAVPALPNALALLDRTFYVGLANRGYDPSTYDEQGEHHYAYADKASGSLWRLGP